MRTHDPSKRSAGDQLVRLRPRGHCDRRCERYLIQYDEQHGLLLEEQMANESNPLYYLIIDRLPLPLDPSFTSTLVIPKPLTLSHLTLLVRSTIQL
jgi:hypothetical protein